MTQKVTMEHVASVETVLQPWRQNSFHHKKLWRKLYSQTAQESNVKTLFKTTVANNSTVKYIFILKEALKIYIWFLNWLTHIFTCSWGKCIFEMI